jgi:antiviral helicase SKI2
MDKADSTGIIDKKAKEASEKTMHDLAVLHEDLASLPELPEVEWTRMRALDFQDLLKQRMILSDRIAKLGCQVCEDFDDHVSSLRGHLNNLANMVTIVCYFT